jgi:hypothetical protein
MKYKTILGSAVLGLTIILLTMSGAVTQAQINSTSFGTNQISLDPIFIEEMKVVAGIDAAALVQITLMGDSAPAITSNTLFNNVVNWLFIASDQDNYHPYLMRRPFKAPENATLILEIEGSLGADGSLGTAIQIAILFATTYDVGLMWARADKLDNGNYLYFFTGSMENTIFNTLITEIQTDITSGFASLLDAIVISAAPVKAVVIGEGFLEGRKLPVRLVTYVDTDAIVDEGGGVYTLSTANLFGTIVTPAVGIGLKYSVIQYRFPYTINPTVISPRTDNFAPQITGKMDWVLNVPWMIPRVGMDYVVSYNIDHSEFASVPRVAVNMDYNQTMLNVDGRFQMDYVVSNTGTEDAYDIDINYALGPDFLDFLAVKPDLPALRSDVTVNPAYHQEITGTITVTFDGALFPDGVYPDLVGSQVVLILDGWYQNNTDASMVNLNSANTDIVVGGDTQIFDVAGVTGTVNTVISLSTLDANGLPDILVNQAIAFLSNVDIGAYTPANIINIFGDYEAELVAAVQAAGDDLFNLLYTIEPIFVPDLMDFGYSVREVGDIGSDAAAVSQVYLNSTIPFLAAGNSLTLSWALDNVPAKDMHFGIMGVAPVDVGASYNALQLSTIDRTGYDLMRLLFGAGDPAGGKFTYSRPISYYDPWLDIWFSGGAMFKYEDFEGFEYFGFSNGINLQIADDEAVLNVNVSLNQTSYKVGDPVTAYYSIENTGNLPAENVQLLLVHGRMGNDWQIREPDPFWYDNIGTVGVGQTYYGQADVNANSFLGIHSVYAIVYFDSDVGQTPLVDGLVDFGPGLVTVFEGAAETHQVVLSNMDWAVLLPKTQARRPAFPQPVLEIDVDVNIIIPTNAPWELELTITITNVGESATHITAIQFYNATEMDLLSKSSSKGSIINATQYGMGVVVFQGITLAPGESVVLTMRWMFLTSNGCYIPGIYIIYDSRFENELGGDEVQGNDDVQNPIMMALNGQSQDEEDWEDYGQSTQTGTSAGADVFTGGEHTRRLGSYDILLWSIGAVIVTAVAATIRKKLKK